MHATSAYFFASRASSERVSGGTNESSGFGTIGASTPSTSRKSAASDGSVTIRVSASTGRRVSEVPKLLAIGLVSGFFGALFGVGGGIVIVPLLTLWLLFDQRRASATSLAAILISSIAGAVTYAFHGDVKPGAAMLVGIPAVVGVLAGTALQQRIPLNKLTYGFAILLAAVGVRLLV
jgi:uncharacterized membrane protein YfcA